MSRARLLAMMLAVTPAAHAQGWTGNGRAIPPRADQAASGSFAVMQVATTNPEALVAAWNVPGLAGDCLITAEFDGTGPNGAPSGVTTAVPVWRGPRPVQPAGFQLGPTGFGLRFDGSDAPGAYRMRATITDQVARLTLRTDDVPMLRGK